MQTIKGEPACLVAATLAQAEMTLHAASADNSKLGRLATSMGGRNAVVTAYEYYLELVTTGRAPHAEG